MKKLVFVMMAFVGMTFAACNGCQNGEVATDSVAVDSVVVVDTVDTVFVDSIALILWKFASTNHRTEFQPITWSGQCSPDLFLLPATIYH